MRDGVRAKSSCASVETSMGSRLPNVKVEPIHLPFEYPGLIDSAAPSNIAPCPRRIQFPQLFGGKVMFSSSPCRHCQRRQEPSAEQFSPREKLPDTHIDSRIQQPDRSFQSETKCILKCSPIQPLSFTRNTAR